jgi:pimeloyl-ACP methyl ester carboxylesterase
MGGIVLLLLAVALLALRDDPARPVAGERRVAELEDADVHYFVGGPPGGRPVALLPSYGRSVSDLNELASALHAAGYRTLAMQPRGIDGSELPSLSPRLQRYAADLAAILAQEDIRQPVMVIGHAYGNRIARTLAQDFPDRVDSLVLLSAGGDVPPSSEMSQAIAKAVFPIFPEATQRAAIRAAFFAEGNPVPESWMRGWYPMAALAQGQATANTPYAEWGDGGRAPMLAIEPGEDAMAPGAAERLQQRHPDRVRVVVIDGAGHALLPEQPEAVLRHVLQFLDGRF